MNHGMSQDMWKVRLRQFRYIPLFYLVFSTLLIYASDHVVFMIYKNDDAVRRMTDYKNLIFIALTSFILFYVIRVLANSLEKSHEMILKMSYLDELTGTVTRKIFIDRIERLVALSERTKFCFGLLYVDILDFDGINHVHGYMAGDKVLVELASRLSRITRKSDTVSRFGGDEFLILVPEIKCQEGLEHIKLKLKEAFQHPFIINEALRIDVSGSIGGALFSDNGTTLDELIKSADADMERTDTKH